MHRWSPLNERQLNLLTRIAEDVDPVTSDDPKLAVTARALKDRGLITMPRSAGKWRAEVTDAGRFYLRNGHHPDRPDRAPRKRRSEAGDAEAQPSPAPAAQQPSAGEDIEARKSAARASRPSLEIPGPVLIKMVQKEGSRASLQADLANAQARNTRLSARVQQLERRLSETLGEQAWRESGLGAPADIDELQRQITRLEQQNVELTGAPEETRADLDAARAANRDLTRALNQRG